MSSHSVSLGPPVNRVEGRLKVTGSAEYSMDVHASELAHAVLVQSTIARGRIVAMNVGAAQRAPGVLAVVTYENAPKLHDGPVTPLGGSPLPPLQSETIFHHGQHVAMVVAETVQQAEAAAALVDITYESEQPALTHAASPGEPFPHPWVSDEERGNPVDALASAEVRFEATYVTAENTHNPIGLFATVASWNGDDLTVHDSTQWPDGVQTTLAQAFGIDPGRVRVLTPYVGGAFGAGLRVWPHVTLAALAARMTGRPVKLTLSRAQMFTSVGHRPGTVQQLAIGATRAGTLVAITHESTSAIGMVDELFNPVTTATAESYACPNVSVRSRQVRLNVPPPNWMRAPGHAEGLYALESAVDELSYLLGIDPLELRIRNHADVHPHSGHPWSSNRLLECYQLGAERFGWQSRHPQPCSMRRGRSLVGYGMARAALSAYQAPCEARASLHRDGTAFVRSAATDIGTGTYTVMGLIASERLGIPLERVRLGLGDSTMPNAPQQGGSGLATALGNAVHDACVQLVQSVVDLIRRDERSPLHGCTLETVTVGDGGVRLTADPSRFERYSDILTRHNLDELTVDGKSAPPGEAAGTTYLVEGGRFVPHRTESTRTTAAAGSFAAHFVEVRVEPDLGIARVARVVTAVDGGRILNEKTARSQIIGGIVGGIGMALLEETVSDRWGRRINASLGEYLIATNADVPDIDVMFVSSPDPMTPVGSKGIGELALVGVAAAVGNAVYHATGRRVRELPISLERVLGLE